MAHHIVAIHIYDLHGFYGKSVLAVVLLEVDSEAGNTLTAAGHTGNLHTELQITSWYMRQSVSFCRSCR